ncbi:hypothetical protein EYR40_011091 [Pleurotus pulmonarius]|nr:hypothetical protein EYR36_002859 [Pleurotus pulmonarius]KAF4587070.1 hypothetical protein EYR40_011091 [Pleurotus pulmonarius]
MGFDTKNKATSQQPPYPLRNDSPHFRKISRYIGSLSLVLIAVSVAYYFCPGHLLARAAVAAGHTAHGQHLRASDPVCPQADALVPGVNHDLWLTLGEALSTQGFQDRAVYAISGAVKIKGESFGDMGPVGNDSRWEVHAAMHDYLVRAFPLINKFLKREIVNTYGLLYTWEGSDPSLKPLLMLAHMDTVPVDEDTLGAWTHPPWSGDFDGTYIWGRGSADDKSGMIGTMLAIEMLIGRRFSPTRTVILAFGFDEEIGGVQGAGHISPVLQQRYGPNSFAAILDEGGSFGEEYGSIFASPGIAEKGSMNVRMEITGAGGHSSVPPAHTSIGKLAAAIVKLEDNPFEAHLLRESVIYRRLLCLAQYGADMDPMLRQKIKDSMTSDQSLLELEKILFSGAPIVKTLVSTTQSVNVIQGGFAPNALPDRASAIVNHRIDSLSSSAAVKARDTYTLVDVAQRFNLNYNPFGAQNYHSAAFTGNFSLVATTLLEPSPISPTDGVAYHILSGSIIAAYNAYNWTNSTHSKGEGDDTIFVTPALPSGNTDTRFYWNLSSNIYRYSHDNFGSPDHPLGGGVHSVNERKYSSPFSMLILTHVPSQTPMNDTKEPIPRTTSPNELDPEVEGLPDYAVSNASHSRPPQYSLHTRPSHALVYTFTDWASDSMLLMPPRPSPSPSSSRLTIPQPVYHISVSLNLNPFLPISYTTTIRHGGDAQGPFVGSFEMSLSQMRAIVTIGDITTRLSRILSSVNGSLRHWTWNCGNVHLRWDCRNVLDDGSPMCICYAHDSVSTQLASFVPPPINASPPLPAATLTVFPEGHDCFDHILISALIVERKRTLDY